MSLKVELERKKIPILKATHAIINTMLDALKENPEIDSSTLKSVATVSNNSFYGKFLKFLEKLGGWELGSESQILPYVCVYLDAPAYQLYRCYQNYLNLLLNSEISRAADASEKESLSNQFVLVRELLLRTVALALSIKPDDAEHGDKVLSFLNSFIKKLISNENLLKKGFFTATKLSITSISLPYAHSEWILLLSEMVRIMEKIHAPLTSISQTLMHLDFLKSKIAGYIIVLENPNILRSRDYSLSSDWIMTTFLKFEDQKIGTASSSSRDVVSARASETIQAAKPWFETAHTLSLRQKTVISRCNADNRTRLKELYQKLNTTNLIYLIVAQVEMLVNMGGWLFLLSNVLNTRNLEDITQEHYEQVTALLNATISPADFYDNRDEPAYQELFREQADTTDRWVRGFSSVSKNISLLNSPVIRQQLFDIVSGSVARLVEYQHSIPSTYGNRQLISPKYLQQPLTAVMSATHALTDPTSSAVIPISLFEETWNVEVNGVPIKLTVLKFDGEVDIFDLIGVRRSLVMAAIKECLISTSIEPNLKRRIESCIRNQMVAIALSDDHTSLPESIRNEQLYQDLREKSFSKGSEELDQHFDLTHMVKFINYFYLEYSDTAGYFQNEIDMLGYRNFDMTVLSLISELGFHFYIWEFNSFDNRLVETITRTNKYNKGDKIHLLYDSKSQQVFRLLEPKSNALTAKFDDERRLLLQRPLVLFKTADNLPRDYPTLLQKYIVSDNVEALRELVEGKTSIVNSVINEWGYTSLFYAVREGRVAQVKLLLANGANPNHQVKGKGKYGGWTPLCIAIANFGDRDAKTQFSMVRALLENGARTDHCIAHTSQGATKCEGGPWDGWTPLTMAVHNWENRGHNPAAMVELLLQYGANPHHMIDAPEYWWNQQTPLLLFNRRTWLKDEVQRQKITAVLERYPNQTGENSQFTTLPEISKCGEIVYQKPSCSAESSVQRNPSAPDVPQGSHHRQSQSSRHLTQSAPITFLSGQPLRRGESSSHKQGESSSPTPP